MVFTLNVGRELINGCVATLKVVHRNLKKGIMVLRPENLDDLWVLYNTILPGDLVYAKTQRRVKSQEETLRQDSGQRVTLYLGVRAEDVYYDPNFNRLRVKGLIFEGPEDLVKIKSYHTLNLELGFEVKIVKDAWPEYLIKRVKESLESESRPRVLVIAIEEGEACIAKVGDYGVEVAANISENIPGKQEDTKQRDPILEKFFSDIYRVIKQSLSDRRIKSIVIAGPGFTKERLLAYLGRDKDVYRISSLENASNGGRAGVSEVIRRGALTKVLEEIRLVEESDLMGELLRRLGKEEKTAVYGRDEVVKAAQFGAIETMLITDRLLRGAQAEDRAKLDTLLRTVEKARGKVVILSADNEPGEQLSSLGGIAALLRFAIA